MNKVEDISWGNAGSHLEQWYLDPTSINEEVLFLDFSELSYTRCTHYEKQKLSSKILFRRRYFLS